MNISFFHGNTSDMRDVEENFAIDLQIFIIWGDWHEKKDVCTSIITDFGLHRE